MVYNVDNIIYYTFIYLSRHRRAFKQCVFINIPSVSPPTSYHTQTQTAPNVMILINIRTIRLRAAKTLGSRPRNTNVYNTHTL